MDQKVLDYITNNRVSCLTVLLPDGSLHAATLHYSHQSELLELYFSTDKTSRKCQGLLNGEEVKASVVIGFSEEEWITLQMDGKVQVILEKEEVERVQNIHYPKHPNSEKFKDDPDTIFLKFNLMWWRYTDYNTEPYTILSSED